ncbi:MAG: Fe-S protein assembly co-chaperone HscB, partial [Bdellovibrionota bacterium]
MKHFFEVAKAGSFAKASQRLRISQSALSKAVQLLEESGKVRLFERSKELHPDRYASAPAAERVAALSKSRALNDAYQQLKKPVPRAEYLLSRAGVSIGENERIADTAFLMEILEIREELSEARVAKRTSDIEKL